MRMDSLAVSAIGLAAGGWDKVKLVSMIFINGNGSKTTSTWKLGIAQIFSSANGTTNLIVTALVFPGCTTGNSGYTVTFSNSTITAKAGSVGGAQYASAVLFKW